MALSDTGIRKAKPGDKPQKLTDGAGLYLLLNPNGSKWQRFDYRFDGKRKTISMGTYPDTGLAEARERRDAARKQLQAGVDPGAHRRAEKVADVERAANSFAVIAEEWLAKQTGKMVPATYEQARWTFDTLVNPWTGDITAHGFRATFSTTLNEQGNNPDVMERALAHVPKDKIRAAYHRSKCLEDRLVLLQTWADMIHAKRTGANAVRLGRKA